MGVSQPLRLVVDQRAHADELRRFEDNVVRGPGGEDCAIWCSAIGADGYGRFWVRRGGTRIMVRANRYALATAMNGKALEPWVRALHGCDNPACVRASLPGEIGLLHIIGGSQRDNMMMTARAGRGGGRVAVRRGDHGIKARRARAVALREAVRHRWDAEAVRGSAAGFHRPDTVVSRTAATQSRTAAGRQRPSDKGAWRRKSGRAGRADTTVQDCRRWACGGSVSARRRVSPSGKWSEAIDKQVQEASDGAHLGGGEPLAGGGE